MERREMDHREPTYLDTNKGGMLKTIFFSEKQLARKLGEGATGGLPKKWKVQERKYLLTDFQFCAFLYAFSVLVNNIIHQLLKTLFRLEACNSFNRSPITKEN